MADMVTRTPGSDLTRARDTCVATRDLPSDVGEAGSFLTRDVDPGDLKTEAGLSWQTQMARDVATVCQLNVASFASYPL